MRKQLQRSELVASYHPVTQKLLASLLHFSRDKVHRIFHEDFGKRKM
jgi:AraC-like DNA-binding protein